MKFNVSQFEKVMEKYYPKTAPFFIYPHKYYKGITRLWNYLDAVEMIDWKEYIKKKSIILDLGGGVGWLSAYFSKMGNIKKIFNLDSSNYSLKKMMPELVKLFKGDLKKIVPVEGFFSPILFKDNSIDVIVASASLHHAENMEEVLSEIERVLKKNGYLFILNEHPLSYFSFFWLFIKELIKIIMDMVFLKYKSILRSISTGKILSDPYLGDRSYPLWYWKKVIKISGFKIVKIIDTKLLTIKKSKKGPSLVHFICEKIN